MWVWTRAGARARRKGHCGGLHSLLGCGNLLADDDGDGVKV